MSLLILHTRAFHPDKEFGFTGLYYSGDNRGFTADLGVKSRMYHSLEIDLKTTEVTLGPVDSDTSSNYATAKVGIDISNDYSQDRKKPRHNNTASITPYREDGDQSVMATVNLAGKNFAFPAADSDVMHKVYGGEVSDGGSDTDSGSVIPFGVQNPVRNEEGDWTLRSPIAKTDKFSGFVPDVDLRNELTLRIDRDTMKAFVTCNMTGDGFPNSESFLIDGASNVLFLASHIRIGTAVGQIPGGRHLAIAQTVLTDLDGNADDSFGAKLVVQQALDYTGSGAPHEIARGPMSRSAWNTAHTGRDAGGPLSRQIRDNVFLPKSERIDSAIDWVGEKLGM